MFKNVSGQVIGAQLISKTDGSDVTSGTTTVYVTVDGGTQAAGSVGSGAATHEGNGFWTYLPSQSETNGGHVAFTFVNTSAISATVQVYPSISVWDETRSEHTTVGSFGEVVEAGDIVTAMFSTDSGETAATAVAGSVVKEIIDNSAGSGGATASEIAAAVADEALAGHTTAGTLGKAVSDILTDTGTTLDTAITTIDTVVDAIKLKTDNLPADPASDTNVDAVEAKVDIVDTNVDAVKAKTDQMNFTGVANRLNVNTTHMNEIEVGGSGTSIDPWGPAA